MHLMKAKKKTDMQHTAVKVCSIPTLNIKSLSSFRMRKHKKRVVQFTFQSSEKLFFFKLNKSNVGFTINFNLINQLTINREKNTFSH